MRAAPENSEGLSALLFLDEWTGDLRVPTPGLAQATELCDELSSGGAPVPRSAHLARRPQVRHAHEGEDDTRPRMWMIQTSQPHEHAEDPFGMQRPSDRDEQASAELGSQAWVDKTPA